MLGGNLELAADMMFTEFFKEVVIPVKEQVVMADARADKNLFDSFKAA